MRKVRFWILLGLVSGLVLIPVACGPVSTESLSPIGPASDENAPDTGEESHDKAQEITDLIRQDLSERLNTPIDQITVVEVQAVDWPDASLGCPQPGRSYAMIVTPGYKVTLKAGERTYTYHAGGNQFVLCENVPPADDERKSVGEEPEQPGAALVEQAKKDLSNRLKAAVETITLQTIVPVQWRDSSLGCPEPGMNYLMVITPGYLIKLEAGGKVYEYHASDKRVVFCENPQPPLEVTPPDESDEAAGLVALAKTALAQQLKVAAEDIQVVKVQAVEWPDASLGCPKPGMMYAQVLTPGYQIILSAQGQEYDYHTNLKEVFLCSK